MGIFTSIPKYLGKMGTFLFGDELEPVAPKKPRKRPDHTKITQQQYDYIVQAKKRFKDKALFQEPSERLPIKTLVDDLNDRLGLDKSYRYYQRIWAGQLKREDCFPHTAD